MFIASTMGMLGVAACASQALQPSAPKPKAAPPAAVVSRAPVPFPCPLITEILYAVPTGERGDANGDGTRETNGDEFIELINPHDQPINLRGFRIRDAAALEDKGKAGARIDFTFPACELAPGQTVVVFNGYGAKWKESVGDARQAPREVNPNLGGALVFSMRIDSARTGLSNKGDLVVLSSADGKPVHVVVWGEAPIKSPAGALLSEIAPLTSGQSVQRTSLAGEWQSHGGSKPFSPGEFESGLSKPDPASDTDGSSPTPVSNPNTPSTPDTNGPKPLEPIISEILVKLPSKADPDKDGTHDASGDQFVELVNPHGQAIGLAGAELSFGDQRGELAKFTLPDLELQPGQALVVFNASARAGRTVPGLFTPREKTDKSATKPAPKPGDVQAIKPLEPNPKFSNAFVLVLPTAPRAWNPQQGWVTYRSASGLVVETLWWGKPPAPDALAMTADVIEQVAFENPGSMRRNPASGSFESHPPISGVLFSPGRTEFKPTATTDATSPANDPK